MRPIALKEALDNYFATQEGVNAKARLDRAHRKLTVMPPEDRKAHTARNGPNKWRPIKDSLTNTLGRKCWYTEVELVGAPLAIDHYRPICDYWWLSFDPGNYRLACPWANSPEHNAAHGCAGGKGDNFPLIAPGVRATNNDELRDERPVILDPCEAEDCHLLAFQIDGRPVIHPDFVDDLVAVQRVEASKILLNLDHPEFNSKREQLYHEICEDVGLYEALPAPSPNRNVIRQRLASRVASNAPFSVAARQYLGMRKDLDWVADLLRVA